jgi:hypothetical protein
MATLAVAMPYLGHSSYPFAETGGKVGSIPAAFEREYERTRSELRTLTEKLEGVRIRKEALERSSTQVKQRQYEPLRVSRFIGSLEQSLQTYRRIGTGGDLVAEIHEISERIVELRQKIDQARISEKTSRALREVSQNAGRLLPSLDCERPNDPISLSIPNLTIQIEGRNRTDYLWEVGSGSNWLSYHVAVSLAWHRFFLDSRYTPVPSFITYDQPGQVYFPRKLSSKPNDNIELDPKLEDEDVLALQKVYQGFLLFCGTTERKVPDCRTRPCSEQYLGKHRQYSLHKRLEYAILLSSHMLGNHQFS